MKTIIEQLKKGNMVIRLLTLSASLLLLPVLLLAQSSKENEYCSGEVGTDIDFETIPGKLYATYSEDDKGIVIS